MINAVRVHVRTAQIVFLIQLNEADLFANVHLYGKELFVKHTVSRSRVRMNPPYPLIPYPPYYIIPLTIKAGNKPINLLNVFD